MRTTTRMTLHVVFLTFATLAQAQESQSTQPLHYTRIYADSTGASHFADEDMTLALVDPGRGIQPTPASAPIAAAGLMFFCPPAGAFVDWHPVPRRQFNIILSGVFEVEVSDGEVRRFGPGSVLLGEDTEGQGHRTRVLGSEQVCFVALPLATQ